VRDFFGFFRQNGVEIFNSVLRVTEAVSGSLLNFTRAFIDAIPELTALGVVVLNTVLPALTSLIQGIEDIINIGMDSNGLADFLKRLITRAAAFLNGEGGQLIQNLSSTLINTAGQLLTDLEQWLTQGGGEQQITDFVNNIFGTLAQKLKTVDEDKIRSVQGTFLSIIGSLFDAVFTSLNSDEAQSLGGQLGRIASQALIILGDQLIEYARSPEFQEDLSLLVSAIVNSFGQLLVQALPGTILRLLGVDLAPPGAAETQFDPRDQQSGTAIPQPRGPTPARQGGELSEPSVNLSVEVKGDTGVVEDVAVNAANSTVTERERRINRNTNSSYQPRN